MIAIFFMVIQTKAARQRKAIDDAPFILDEERPLRRRESFVATGTASRILVLQLCLEILTAGDERMVAEQFERRGELAVENAIANLRRARIFSDASRAKVSGEVGALGPFLLEGKFRRGRSPPAGMRQ